MCAAFGSSYGGDGGRGCTDGAGSPGTAIPSAPVTIAGYDGFARAMSLPDGGTSPTADPGADGLAGSGGAAAPAQVYGTLSASGWVARSGGDGSPGNPGQGGAGATDQLFPGGCSAPTISLGGAGGGAGGCGGSGGLGGQGGGASLAVASVGSNVDLKQCSMHLAAGGQGGAGGAGQNGQAGGLGGVLASVPPGSTYAYGEFGGNGAAGSGGAGGTGGLSIGVLYQGGQVTFDMLTTQGIALGPSGAGGAPGSGGKHATNGPALTGFDGNPGAAGSEGVAIPYLQVQ